jgi:hypothetical protein
MLVYGKIIQRIIIIKKGFMSKSFQNDTIKPKGYQKWLGVLIK